MEKEIHDKLMLDVDKVLKGFENFSKLPADGVRECFEQLVGISNAFVSNLLGRKCDMDSDYFVLKSMMDEDTFDELSETYFAISSLAGKSFTKVSRDAVRVSSWKNSEIVDRKSAMEMTKNLKKLMISAWKSVKGS